MNDTADRNREKEEALQRRREELEGELDRYAQVGAYSPGLVKASRWVSRFLYLAMAATLVFLLFSGWGKYSDEEMQRAVSRANEMKTLLDSEREKTKDLELERDAARIENMLLRSERESAQGPEAADRALAEARRMLDATWGETAYAEHWRERLKGAEPEAHGVDPLMAARSLIRQAVSSPAAQRQELLRETLDFGREATTRAVKELAVDDNVEVATAALRVAVWLGGDEVTAFVRGRMKARAASEKTEADAALALAYSLLTHEAPPEGWTIAEAWVGYATRTYDSPQDGLVAVYRSAPQHSRLALLALLAEAGGEPEAGLFRQVATSDRPEAERIIAVRWIGARKDEGSRALLKGLAEGRTALALEAKDALTALDRK